jgi:hypothetical protein
VRARASEARRRDGVDAAVRHEHHVLAAELLLEFTHEPLLDLVERLEKAEGNLDDDRGAAARDVNLLRAVDVQVPKVRLELVVRSLKVEQGLGGERATAGREER